MFIDILRNKGAYPDARCFAHHNGPQPITVWCSNDYLAMGQHPKVIAAVQEAAAKFLHICGSDFYFEGMAALSERLARLTPGKSPNAPCGNAKSTGIVTLRLRILK